MEYENSQNGLREGESYAVSSTAPTAPESIKTGKAAPPERPAVKDADESNNVADSARAKKSIAPTVVAILLLVLLIVTGIASCGNSGSLGSGSVVKGNTVAVIDLAGTIQYDGTACSPAGFKSLLDEAQADDNVKAVVLRVNSGGGTATAGEEMTTYLKQFTKPVVVSSASLNASAAYEISSQADYIFVAATSEIGAIGTAREMINYSDLMDMLGIDVDVIVSADSKDSTYGYRELTEEEREHYQKMVDECNQVFIDNVAEGRNVTVQKATEWANGLTWTGKTAVEMGIADEIGTVEDACDKAAEIAGCKDNYTTSSLYIEGASFGGLFDLFSESSSQGVATAEDIATALKELKSDGSGIN